MLGQYGLLPDAAPENLPPNAWNAGNNVRFDHNQVYRAPSFRTVDQGLLQTSPAFVMNVTAPDGVDYIVIANNDGKLTKWSGGTETDVTPTSGFTAATGSRAFSGCVLGNVVYVNRPDRVPYGLKPSSTDFETIPAWDSNWRCSALRAFGDYLIALNVTKSGTDNPQLVKWSNATLINAFPDSFDETDPTKLSGENPLSALNGPLVDGLALKNAFILYGKRQSFIMTLSNDQFVFNFDKLFDDAGIIAPNCVVEVDGKHYVFGPSDIYVHDGVSKQSISDGKIKEWVFRNLDLSKAETFFVFHDPVLNEVVFCFVSSDSEAGFQGTSYPNRAVAFNYENETWSIRDLPNVVGAAVVNAETALTWANVPGSWTSQGGTWYQTGSGEARGVVMVKPNDSISAETIFALDSFDMGSRFPFPLFTAGIKPSWVRRTGLDLSELGAEVRDWKRFRCIMPIAQMQDALNSMYVRLGSAQTAAGDITWEATKAFNPRTDYKVDSRRGGRFLSVEMGISDNVDFKVGGYDLDFTVMSHR